MLEQPFTKPTSPLSGALLSPTRDDIKRHYDVSNDFYALWLDPAMVYSAALFNNNESLSEAQQNKLIYHIKEARAESARKVLDIGCGWGSLLFNLAKKNPLMKCTGLTLSHQQAQFIKANRLPNIEILEQGWNQFQTKDIFQSMICIGALEHFARPHLSRVEKTKIYRRFFQFCHSHLEDGKYLSLQTITYGQNDFKQLHPFINQTIFPNSDLPHFTELEKASAGLFTIDKGVHAAEDYRKTCGIWQQNIRQNYEELVYLVGPKRVKNYLIYLRMSERGFKKRDLDLVRLTLRKRPSYL